FPLHDRGSFHPYLVFFFSSRRRHTRFSRDWSSDVCSSDLRARRYFASRHGLEVAALDGFASTDAYEIGNLGPENARAAMLRLDRPDVEAFVIPGANFATMAAIADRKSGV